MTDDGTPKNDLRVPDGDLGKQIQDDHKADRDVGTSTTNLGCIVHCLIILRHQLLQLYRLWVKNGLQVSAMGEGQVMMQLEESVEEDCSLHRDCRYSENFVGSIYGPSYSLKQSQACGLFPMLRIDTLVESPWGEPGLPRNHRQAVMRQMLCSL